MKNILITGITGQDGIFLTSEILKEQEEYNIFGITRNPNNQCFFNNLKTFPIIKTLFNKIKLSPKKFIDKKQLNNNKYRAISDFISGMTDRYAINLNRSIK